MLRRRQERWGLCVVDRLGPRFNSQHAHPRSSRRGFANPELLAFLDCEVGVEYMVAMASNAALNRTAEEAMQVARLLAGLTDRTEHVYGEARYAAGSWDQERRVILKAEVVRAEDKAPKDSPRFVVTNMKQAPQWLYEEVYCQRGEIENRIMGAPAKPAKSRGEVSCAEGVAIHSGPESCAVAREGEFEALTGEPTGQPWSRENGLCCERRHSL